MGVGLLDERVGVGGGGGVLDVLVVGGGVGGFY